MPDADRPNLLLITTDQQRYDTIGPRAPTFLRTPHLDFLQRQGVRFENAYSSCPVCVPARTAIMTGEDVFAHGMRYNPGPADQSDVIDPDRSLPGRLGNIGYATAAIGKMHFRPQRARYGFDEMILPREYYRAHHESGEPRQPYRHGIGQNELYPAKSTVPENRTLTAWITDECVDYVRERRDPTRPFMLWCSFSEPHPPFDPPDPYYSMYDDSPIPDPVESDWMDDLPPWIDNRQFCSASVPDSTETLRAARAAYYGTITAIDYQLGRLFGALSEAGELDNTLILFASDHGEFLGDHGLGSKGPFHEASAHVPMIVRYPIGYDDRPGGTTCSAPVQLADILPTFVSAAGGDASGVHGRDLTPVVRGQEPPREYVDGGFGSPAFDYGAITDGDWKYVWYVEGGEEHLFHLEEDSDETRNLATEATHDERREEMRATLLERHRERGTDLVDGDDLLERPVGDASDRSTALWEGFHTDRYGYGDILH